MKCKVFTPNAQQQIDQIGEYIYLKNPEAGIRYINAAHMSFLDIPDEVYPVRASYELPECVRQIQVQGFRGYTLRLAYIKNQIGLIAAFRPGLTDDMRDQSTQIGLQELKDL